MDRKVAHDWRKVECIVCTARLGTPPPAREAHTLVQRRESEERENEDKDQGVAERRDEVEGEEGENGDKDGAEDTRWWQRFGGARRGEQRRAGGRDEQGNNPARKDEVSCRSSGTASTQTHCIKSRRP